VRKGEGRSERLKVVVATRTLVVIEAAAGQACSEEAFECTRRSTTLEDCGGQSRHRNGGVAAA
jgi:hypothetical protein